jgi:hypothetical protein
MTLRILVDMVKQELGMFVVRIRAHQRQHVVFEDLTFWRPESQVHEPVE